MTNDEMLRNIEYLREKANVSYEEAEELLERNDGNVMRVLVELERQGRVYESGTSGGNAHSREWQEECQRGANEAKEKATTFFNKAMKTRVVLERKGDSGEKSTIINLSAPVAVGAAILAPYLAVASAGAAFLTGCQVKIKKEKAEEDKQDNA